MRQTRGIQLETIPIIVLIVSPAFFHEVECWRAPQSDVTYEDLNALNATCGGLDSCELPRDPDSLEHCSCSRYCSLLGTCCIDSMYRNRYPKPLENIECHYIGGRKIHRWIPMVNNCDPGLEIHETTEELCKSNGEDSSDPFLKIPVTDPITGISYKNHYCFACNENYGAEEPVAWNLELTAKINESSAPKTRFSRSRKTSARTASSSSKSNQEYDSSRGAWVVKITSSSLPDLHYDKIRKTWVMDHNQENETDVQFTASLPDWLKNITPICYDMVFPIVSECAPDWKDGNTEKFCKAYMAVISIQRKDSFLPQYYHNPHCAICNYESMDDMDCYVEENDYVYPLWESDVLLLRLFSFRDKMTKPCESHMVYDHFAKKCRRLYKAKRRV